MIFSKPALRVGALVALRLVITSGNCFTNQTKASQLKVWISGGRTLEAASLHQSIYPEISFISLKSSATGIKPIGICQQPLKMGSYVNMMMASPFLSYYGRRRSQLISNRACKSTYLQDESVYITPNMLCLTNSLKPSKCATIRGDSLLMKNCLCAINIYGSKCHSRSQNADLYANLYTMRQYINVFIKKLEK
ncbi:uncharacterized protein LOC6648044 [Drosophila willistoni]|uniref:uncharacterized protein LOC6648044 n=1 Tax=Drosophila willistoni TaxID=7260 RepID=UPI000C26CC88|nr:uncharacterized protein LOC6648044 [Drosophila willistoni]